MRPKVESLDFGQDLGLKLLFLVVHDLPFGFQGVGMVIGLESESLSSVLLSLRKLERVTYENHHSKEQHLVQEDTLISHILPAWTLREALSLLHHLLLLVPSSIAQSQIRTYHQYSSGDT